MKEAKAKKLSFEEIKALILERATKKDACSSQHSRAAAATNEEELMAVVKDNFYWCMSYKLFTREEVSEWFDLAKYHIYFDAADVQITTTGDEKIVILLYGSTTATVRSRENSQATVRSRENSQATVRSRENSQATVESWGNSQATVESRENSQATVRSRENSQATVSNPGYGSKLDKTVNDSALIRDLDAREILISKDMAFKLETIKKAQAKE